MGVVRFSAHGPESKKFLRRFFQKAAASNMHNLFDQRRLAGK